VINLPKSPNAVYAEMLALIEVLEGEYSSICDVNAQVADEGLLRLSALRAEIKHLSKGVMKEISLAVVRSVLAKLAWEVIQWLISTTTSIYKRSALLLRVIAYEGWRCGTNTARFRRL
jgi:hypothetical protein